MRCGVCSGPGGSASTPSGTLLIPTTAAGIPRGGEDLCESSGFIVHYFDRAKVERVAREHEILAIEEFEEGTLPRRLYRVVMRKPQL